MTAAKWIPAIGDWVYTDGEIFPVAKRSKSASTGDIWLYDPDGGKADLDDCEPFEMSDGLEPDELKTALDMCSDMIKHDQWGDIYHLETLTPKQLAQVLYYADPVIRQKFEEMSF